ncbi:hypothetical protein EVAR_48825_1 [Eumeta japonica]|uniref:Uncharacterized protein n=1 Tax=Eumeta variegata TaxID=151549 RepID=A0A4C1Y4K6_EUMVA|nr:hypothetical protein EVAR_48825_1 [Eumeta japonica]
MRPPSSQNASSSSTTNNEFAITRLHKNVNQVVTALVTLVVSDDLFPALANALAHRGRRAAGVIRLKAREVGKEWHRFDRPTCSDTPTNGVAIVGGTRGGCRSVTPKNTSSN